MANSPPHIKQSRVKKRGDESFKSKKISSWQSGLYTRLDKAEERISGLEEMFKNNNTVKKNKYMKNM